MLQKMNDVLVCAGADIAAYNKRLIRWIQAF